MSKISFYRRLGRLGLIASCAVVTVFYIQAATAASSLKVLTSIRPIALIVADIAPADVTVDYLVPAWADPHSYQLKISDMRLIQNVDVIVWLGEDFERFLAKAFAAKKNQAVLTLTQLQNLNWPTLDAHEQSHYESEHNNEHDHHKLGDPHIWLNPSNGMVIGEAIAQQLVAKMPQQQDVIKANLKQWQQKVQQQLGKSLEQLKPYQNVSFAVSHDGYNHFVSAMNLHQQVAVAEVPNQQLSAKKTARLQQQVRDSACMITETKTPHVERLAELFELPLVEADPLAQNTKTDDYLKFIVNLTEAFKQCLQMK